MERFRINLDEPADRRWAHVIAAHAHLAPRLRSLAHGMMRDVFGLDVWKRLEGDEDAQREYARMSWWQRFCTWWTRGHWIYTLVRILTWVVARCWLRPHVWDEVAAFARGYKLDFYHVLWIQSMYELSAGCSTVVLEHGERVFMVRTMDWALGLLRQLTIEVDVYRGGRHLYSGVTWAGFPGMLTATSHCAATRGCTVAINYRRTNLRDWRSMIASFVLRGWSISSLVRDVMEHEADVSFTAMRTRLQETRLFAPTYVMLASPVLGESCMITRDPHASRTDTLGERRRKHNNEAWLVQTNHDHWLEPANVREDIMCSLARTLHCHEACRRLVAQSHVELADVEQAIVCDCVKSFITIYAWSAELGVREHLMHR
jgi:hypothetical protein